MENVKLVSLCLQIYEDQCDTVYEARSECKPSYRQICTGSYERFKLLFGIKLFKNVQQLKKIIFCLNIAGNY